MPEAVTNFARDYNTLYRNLGGLLFQDDSFLSHLAAPTYNSLCWGARASLVDLPSDRFHSVQRPARRPPAHRPPKPSSEEL